MAGGSYVGRPRSAEGHRKRGISLEQEGHYADAVAAFEAAVRLEPEGVESRVHLGLMLRELGRDEEANQVFAAALELLGEGEARRRGPGDQRSLLGL